MVLLNGRFPKLGFFLAQLCLDTQVRGNIGNNVSFASSSIARKAMVEMLYGAPQWEIIQYWFFSCSIVSTLHHDDQVNVAFSSSSIAIKTMVEMLYGAPQWEIPQAWLLSCSIGFFLTQLILSFFLLNVYHAPINP